MVCINNRHPDRSSSNRLFNDILAHPREVIEIIKEGSVVGSIVLALDEILD
jgi:hypothetical protein